MTKIKEALCPNCGSRLEYDAGQDGSCDWHCPACGWHQHVPSGPRHEAQRAKARGLDLP